MFQVLEEHRLRLRAEHVLAVLDEGARKRLHDLVVERIEREPRIPVQPAEAQRQIRRDRAEGVRDDGLRRAEAAAIRIDAEKIAQQAQLRREAAQAAIPYLQQTLSALRTSTSNMLCSKVPMVSL